MSRYLYRYGRGARRRVMHIARYDPFGGIAGTWCGEVRVNTSINLPLGRPLCKRCLKKIGEAQ